MELHWKYDFHLHRCNICRDRNYLVSCKCGCKGILFRRDKYGQKREFLASHAIRLRVQSGDKNFRWKGGISFNKKTGYWTSRKPDHPNAHPNGRVPTHKLIYEHYLYIMTDEELFIPREYAIHHKNGIKTDNSIINLELLTHSEHLVVHQTVDMSDRVCSNQECSDPQGYPKRRWAKDGLGGYICNRCYMKRNRQKYNENRKRKVL